MASFLTQCPHCQTSFSINDEQFRAANGLVRCGSCLKTFSATNNNKANVASAHSPTKASPNKTLSFAAPLNPFAYRHQRPSIKLPPLPTSPTLNPVVQSSYNNKLELHQNISSLDHEDSLETLDFTAIESINHEPLEIITSPPRRLALSVALLFINLLFILTLAAQYTWFNLAELTLDKRFTAATNVLCQYITCPEVETLDLSNIHTEALSVRSHPLIANALQIDFIFKNSANTDQNFPLAELNFSDLNNRLLANRQFTPLEYLPAELRQFTQIPANSTIQVSLEIMDPGPVAVNYSLSYRKP